MLQKGTRSEFPKHRMEGSERWPMTRRLSEIHILLAAASDEQEMPTKLRLRRVADFAHGAALEHDLVELLDHPPWGKSAKAAALRLARGTGTVLLCQLREVTHHVCRSVQLRLQVLDL